MIEKILNIFPLFDGRILKSIGFRIHEIEGTDEDKFAFLKSKIELDFKEMAITLLPDDFTIKLPSETTIKGISLEQYNTLLHNGTEAILYEGISHWFKCSVGSLKSA